MNRDDLMQKFSQRDSGGNTFDTGGFSGGERDIPSRPAGLLGEIDSAMSEVEAQRFAEKEKQASTREVSHYKCGICGITSSTTAGLCSIVPVYE